MSVTADKLVDAAGLLDVLKSVLGGGQASETVKLTVGSTQDTKVYGQVNGQMKIIYDTNIGQQDVEVDALSHVFVSMPNVGSGGMLSSSGNIIELFKGMHNGTYFQALLFVGDSGTAKINTTAGISPS